MSVVVFLRFQICLFWRCV